MWIWKGSALSQQPASRLAQCLRRFAILLALLVVGSGCGSEEPPQDDRALAVGAVEYARRAGAGEYAPEAFARATDELARAEAEWEAQEGKRFGFTRKYQKARELYLSASELAEAAQQEAASRKETLALDLAALSEDLQTRVIQSQSIVDGDAWALFRDRARDPGPMMDLEDELSAVENSLDQMEAAIAEGDRDRALRIGRAALDQLTALEPMIEEASKTGAVKYRFNK